VSIVGVKGPSKISFASGIRTSFRTTSRTSRQQPRQIDSGETPLQRGARRLIVARPHLRARGSRERRVSLRKPRLLLGFNQPHLVDAAEHQKPCTHCNATFASSKHYEIHALNIKHGISGGSAYGTHNHVLHGVAEVAREAGISITVGGDECVAGDIRLASCATKSMKADIKFVGGFYTRYSKPTIS
jgi:hypothetical protein